MGQVGQCFFFFYLQDLHGHLGRGGQARRRRDVDGGRLAGVGRPGVGRGRGAGGRGGLAALLLAALLLLQLLPHQLLPQEDARGHAGRAQGGLGGAMLL